MEYHASRTMMNLRPEEQTRDVNKARIKAAQFFQRAQITKQDKFKDELGPGSEARKKTGYSLLFRPPEHP